MSQTAELVVKLRQVGGEQLTQLAGKLNNLGKQTAAASTDFKSLAAELKKTQAASTQSINNLKGYANAWREIANSVQIGSREFKEANAEAAKLEKQLQKTTQAGRRPTIRGVAQVAGTALAGGIFGGPEGLIGGLAGGIIGGVPGAAAGAAIGGGVSQIRQQLAGLSTYAADINRQRQALQLVTKDAIEYQRALSFIDRTSRDLAIPQELITRQFTQLTASVKGAGGNVRDAEKAFLGIAAGIRGTGGSLEQLDSALLATTQVFSKGKVSAEELRQQIGERLPGAFSLFAESIGMTPQELDKALEKGQVSLLDFQRFAERLFAEYGENAKIIADGPDAAGDRLRASLSRLQESVGTLLKPIGAFFQNVFAGIANAIDQAARALNNFFNLTKERRAAKLRQDIGEITTEVNRLLEIEKKAGGKLPADLAASLTIQQRTLKNLQLQLKSTQIVDAATRRGDGPPSRLPGITPEATSERSRKKKEIVDRTAEELALIIEINKYEREGNVLRAAYAQFQLAEAEVELAMQRGLIGRNQAIERLQEAETRLGKTVEQNMRGIGDMVIRNEESARKLKETIEDLEIKAGMRSEEEIKEIQRKRLINDLEREFGKLSEDNLKRITAAFEKTSQKLTETQELSKSIVQTIGDGLGNALMSVFDKAQSLSEVLSNILKQVANLLINFGIQAGLKGLFPKLFENAMGNVMTERGPLPLKKYARGGITSGPVLSLAGEAGPEAIVPLPDGRTIPVKIKGGMGGGNIVVNVDATGSSVQGDEQQGKALGAVIGAAVQAELIKQKRPGGLLY